MPTYNGKDFKTTTGPDGLPMSSVSDAIASDGSPIYSQAVSITSGTLTFDGGSVVMPTAVSINAGTNSIGTVGLNSGSNVIGGVRIADGADVALGATTDAATITDTTGTLSGKLRGLVKWAYERMPTSLGQKIGATSFPVVLASDQTNVPIATSSFNVIVNPDIGILIGNYATGDVFGSIITLTDALRVTNGAGVLTSVSIVDTSKQSSSLGLFLFRQPPSYGTYTDGQPIVSNVGDVSYLLGAIHISNTDYIPFGSYSVATKSIGGLHVKGNAGNTNLYLLITILGNPSYFSTSPLTLRFGFIQD